MCWRYSGVHAINLHPNGVIAFYFNDSIQMEEIDAIDMALLDQLQRDSSLTNQELAAKVHISPPTCLRRVKRLRDSGLIAREVALVDPDKLAPVLGHGLQAVVEITLERQGNEELEAFESRVIGDP